MGNDNVVFLELIEWFDETGRELVHRIPEKGPGKSNTGPSWWFVKARPESFSTTAGPMMPSAPEGTPWRRSISLILTKVLSLPWGFTSPLRAEVYLVNMKNFIDLKWGTRDPVAFKDSELGLIRLRAFGVFNLKVVQPVLFINSLVGTQGIFTTEEIEEYLSRVIVSRLNDHLGQHLDTLIKLPSRYEELSQGLQKRLEEDFSHFGLALSNLYIVSITPPKKCKRRLTTKAAWRS